MSKPRKNYLHGIRTSMKSCCIRCSVILFTNRGHQLLLTETSSSRTPFVFANAVCRRKRAWWGFLKIETAIVRDLRSISLTNWAFIHLVLLHFATNKFLYVVLTIYRSAPLWLKILLGWTSYAPISVYTRW